MISEACILTQTSWYGIEPAWGPPGKIQAFEIKCVFPNQLATVCWLSLGEIGHEEGTAPKTDLQLL